MAVGPSIEIHTFSVPTIGQIRGAPGVQVPRSTKAVRPDLAYMLSSFCYLWNLEWPMSMSGLDSAWFPPCRLGVVTDEPRFITCTNLYGTPVWDGVSRRLLPLLGSSAFGCSDRNTGITHITKAVS